MKNCPHCHIRVGGTGEFCPLCRNRLSGTGGEPHWPATAPKVRRAILLYKFIAFALLGGAIICCALDYLIDQGEHDHWSLLVLFWVVAILLYLRFIFLRKYNGPSMLFWLLVILSILVLYTDSFFGFTGISSNYIVPILCSITMVLNYIFAFLNIRFAENAMVYLLSNILVGVLPFALLLLFNVGSSRPVTQSLPWVICLILSGITFLGVVIFKGRTLRSEIEKRLHF